MEKLKVGDKLLCKDDYYNYNYCGCLFNGMVTPGDVTFENKNELNSYKLLPSQSYYFKDYIKNNWYNVNDIVIIKKQTLYRIDNEFIKETTYESSLNDIDHIEKYFYTKKEKKEKE